MFKTVKNFKGPKSEMTFKKECINFIHKMAIFSYNYVKITFSEIIHSTNSEFRGKIFKGKSTCENDNILKR